MSIYDYINPARNYLGLSDDHTNDTSDGYSVNPPDLFSSWLGGETTTATQKTTSFENDRFSKAASFTDLIHLVKVAEDRLAAAGIANTPEDVVWVLRGIFYGTEWSMDYEGSGNEKSWMRNKGFNYYTKHSTPDDPRDALGPNLFMALRDSAEVKDPNGKHTDFGHILIGVETQDWLGQLPTLTGGNGNEVVTWLGDLGGGAGMLAMKRGGIASKPQPNLSAYSIFNTSHDYGASINVEGDIAGTVGITLKEGKTFSEVLEEYLVGADGSGGGNYDQRATLFLSSIGGIVKDDKLQNKDALVSKLTGQFVSFGQFYSLTRAKDKSHFNVSPKTLRAAGKHMIGSANEVATIFVSMIEEGITHPEKNIRASKSMDPGVTPEASEPTSQFEIAAIALEKMEEGEKWARDEYNKRKGDLPDPGNWGL